VGDGRARVLDRERKGEAENVVGAVGSLFQLDNVRIGDEVFFISTGANLETLGLGWSSVGEGEGGGQGGQCDCEEHVDLIEYVRDGCVGCQCSKDCEDVLKGMWALRGGGESASES
jgi:hypothetical protein